MHLRQRAMSSYFVYQLVVKSCNRSCRTFNLDLFAAPSPSIASRPFGLIHFRLAGNACAPTWPRGVALMPCGTNEL